MKKILVFGMTENPGGIESVIINYYRKIDKNKFQFDFLTNAKQIAYQEEIETLGGKIYNIISKRENYFKYKRDIKNFFEEHSNEYDAIWMNVCNLNNIDYIKYAKKYGIKKRIIHAHNSKNMGESIKLKLYNYILHSKNKKNIKKYATDYWTCSKSAGEFFYAIDIRKLKTYKIINNAIDTQKYEYNENTRKIYRENLNCSNKLVIGNIGRLNFQKNQNFIIDIFDKLNKDDDRYYLILVGQGEDEEKLKQKVKDLNLNNKVLFMGVRKDIGKILQAMDLFLFPSRFEGLPVTLIEAEASGIDIVTSKEAFPSSVKLPKNVKQISLNQDIDCWVKEIKNICIKSSDRFVASTNNIEFIKLEEYDINEEVRKMEKFFEN